MAQCIRYFRKIGADDVALAGGKTAPVGEMFQTSLQSASRGAGNRQEDREARIHCRSRGRGQLGPHLVGLATAAIDVSDGLFADLRHICEVSGLASCIEAYRVPLSTAARTALATGSRRMATVLAGGDDYEILFTAPQTAKEELAELSRTHDVPITAIGRMDPPSIGKGCQVTVFDESGQSLTFEREGWTHF